MTHAWGFHRTVCLLIAAGIGCAMTVPRASAAPTDLDDRWLSPAVLDALARAAKDAQWEDLDKQVHTLVLQRLTCDHLDKLTALNDMVYVLRAARYLPIADKVDATGKLSAWLVANRDVSRLLFRGLAEAKSPEEALKKFHALLSADEKRVLAYANLTVAFAVGQPMTHYVKQPDAATMAESFAWFTNPKTPFRYDLKAMPFELSQYLADTQLSLAERQWALQRYAQRADLASTYQDLKFDVKYFFHGAPKELTKHKYTLASILDVGGVCIDHAYFASQVCKAMGVPSAIIIGRNAAGGAHAWVANLRLRGSPPQLTAEWDSSTGRTEQQRYYTGTLTDPVSQNKIHDSELALLGAAALLPLDRREEADAATFLAAMVAPLVKAPPAGGVEELQKFAQAYNQGADRSKNPLADPRQIVAARKIDATLVEDLLVEAVNHNLAHRQVWDLVMELRGKKELSDACLNKLFDLLLTRTAKDYPDYSCLMVMKIAPTYADVARREAIYLKSIDVYRQRPDLQGQLMVAWGDDLLKQGKKDAALGAYQQVMAKMRDLTEVFLLAARHAQDLLVADKKTDAAIGMYRKLFAETKKPRQDGGYAQSAYFQLGKRLVDLLTEAGQADEAKKVQDKIGESFDPAIPE